MTHPEAKSELLGFKILSKAQEDTPEMGATLVNIQIQLPKHFTQKRLMPWLALSLVSGFTGYWIASAQTNHLISSPVALISNAQVISEANAHVDVMPFNMDKQLNTQHQIKLTRVSFDLTLEKTLSVSLHTGALQRINKLVQASEDSQKEAISTHLIVAKVKPQKPTMMSDVESVETLEVINPIEKVDNVETADKTYHQVQQAKLALAPKIKPETKPTIIKNVSAEQQSAQYYQQAIAYLQQGRIAEAQDLLKKALTSYPSHHDARQTLVGLLVDHHRLDEATEVLKAGLEMLPSHIPYAQALARLQLDAGFTEQALATLESVAVNAEADAEYYALKAVVLQKLDQHLEAITHYQQALSHGANIPAWLIGMAVSLQIVGRESDAKAVFLQAQQHPLNEDLTLFVEQKLKQLK